jgi:hypothetical protein
VKQAGHGALAAMESADFKRFLQLADGEEWRTDSSAVIHSLYAETFCWNLTYFEGWSLHKGMPLHRNKV